MLKRSLTLILCITLAFTLSLTANAVCPSDISAKSAILIDAKTGEVLFEKSADLSLPMASTTKIMTALVILERCSLADEVFVDERAVGTEGTSAYLQKGDRLTVEAALYALLLQSANDAAVALALHICDDIDGFSELMNEKARELSLKSTFFKNPSGLPADSHRTTARDLALLASYCLENEDFYRIVSTKSITVKISGKDRSFTNHNKLLSLYDGAIGVKTGYTRESGRCLVGACEKDGVRLVSVTLNAKNDWNDHMSMLDYGLSLYRPYTLYKEGDFLVSVPVTGRDTPVIVSPKGEKTVMLKRDTVVTVRLENYSRLSLDESGIICYAVFYSGEKELHRVPLGISGAIS